MTRVESLHPAERIVMIMDRIYNNGLTTASGGNLSVLDEDGAIWITPSRVDKGSLAPDDICRVAPDGTVTGRHRPSVELPFHASVYRRRPDLRAVLHAHPAGIMAFSVARRLPDVNLWADASHICGKIAMAKYAVPGSKELGDSIASEFEKGFDIVVMENHGVCTAAADLSGAFFKFETLELCANIEINARRLGTPRPREIKMFDPPPMDEFAPGEKTEEERAARRDMAAMIGRACRRQLFSGTQGTCSVRLPDNSFLITPHGADRAAIGGEDLVLVREGQREQGKIPSRSAGLYQLIYEKNEAVNAVMGAMPPHMMAFGVTGEEIDPHILPESYIYLRRIKRVPYGKPYEAAETVAGAFSETTHVLICENDRIITTGVSLLKAYDRLELAEFTARSALSARGLGKMEPIPESGIAEIDEIFKDW